MYNLVTAGEMVTKGDVSSIHTPSVQLILDVSFGYYHEGWDCC